MKAKVSYRTQCYRVGFELSEAVGQSRKTTFNRTTSIESIAIQLCVMEVGEREGKEEGKKEREREKERARKREDEGKCLYTPQTQ